MPIEQHPFTSNRWLQNIEDQLIISNWFVSDELNNQGLPLSFGYMPGKDVKSIFLGTFPIWQISSGPFQGNPNIEFFYGSSVNNFWSCLSSITGNEAGNLNDRFGLLANSEIGITDILGMIDRNPGNCNLDSCLTNLQYNSILSLKDNFPSLKNIFVTSGGKGPVQNLNANNGNASTWFLNSVFGQNIAGFNHQGFLKPISINGIGFNLIYLYSPSSSANTAIQGRLNAHNNFGIQNITIQEFRKLQWAYFLREHHFEAGVNPTIDELWNIVVNNNELLNFFNN